jgi:hypothetical protein
VDDGPVEAAASASLTGARRLWYTFGAPNSISMVYLLESTAPDAPGRPPDGSPSWARPLGRARRLGLAAVGIGAWTSGGLWLLFHHGWHHGWPRSSDLGIGPHPLEPWWLALHGAFAVAAIWVAGWLWGAHLARAWGRGRRRWSGGLTVGVLLWLIASGYLLYYLGDERLRLGTAVLHWSVGLASPIAVLLHVPWRARR